MATCAMNTTSVQLRQSVARTNVGNAKHYVPVVARASASTRHSARLSQSIKQATRFTGSVTRFRAAHAQRVVSSRSQRFTTRAAAAEATDGEESKGFLDGIKEKFPWLETATYFFLWYLFNVKFNIINKSIYNYFPYPWFVSCIHLAVGLVVTLFFWGTKIVKFEKIPSMDFVKALLPVAVCHAVGHSLTNVSFASVAVSFTHTIKTLEPVFSSVGSYMAMGTLYSLPVYLSLVPIMAGVAICSATELSFTWLGFSTAMSSNLLFAARAIFSKKLMSTLSSINVYNYVSMFALCICIPPFLYFEGSTLAKGMEIAAVKVGQSQFYWDLWNVGLFYHLYNQVAYQALGKVEPVTHAVGNVGKRIFVIGFSILAFGNKLSTQSIIGSVIAIFGAGLYGYLKAKDKAKKAEEEAAAEAK